MRQQQVKAREICWNKLEWEEFTLGNRKSLIGHGHACLLKPGHGEDHKCGHHEWGNLSKV